MATAWRLGGRGRQQPAHSTGHRPTAATLAGQLRGEHSTRHQHGQRRTAPTEALRPGGRCPQHRQARAPVGGERAVSAAEAPDQPEARHVASGGACAAHATARSRHTLPTHTLQPSHQRPPTASLVPRRQSSVPPPVQRLTVSPAPSAPSRQRTPSSTDSSVSDRCPGSEASVPNVPPPSPPPPRARPSDPAPAPPRTTALTPASPGCAQDTSGRSALAEGGAAPEPVASGDARSARGRRTRERGEVCAATTLTQPPPARHWQRAKRPQHRALTPASGCAQDTSRRAAPTGGGAEREPDADGAARSACGQHAGKRSEVRAATPHQQLPARRPQHPAPDGTGTRHQHRH